MLDQRRDAGGQDESVHQGDYGGSERILGTRDRIVGARIDLEDKRDC